MGNPNEFTMLDLAETIIALVGSKSTLKRCPMAEDDPRQRKPDIGLGKEQRGWKPRVPLKEGLLQTIEYFDRLMKREDIASR